MLGGRGALHSHDVGSRDVGSRDVGSRQVLHDCSREMVKHQAQVAQFRGL
jgi:hypothetical protein